MAASRFPPPPQRLLTYQRFLPDINPPPPPVFSNQIPPPLQLSHDLPPLSPLSSDDVPLPDDLLDQIGMLPDEILFETLLYLDLAELYHLCNTNRRTQRICASKQFWRQKFSISYPLHTFYLRDDDFDPRQKYIELYRFQLDNIKVNVLSSLPIYVLRQMVDDLGITTVKSEEQMIEIILTNMSLQEIKDYVQKPVTKETLMRISVPSLIKFARLLDFVYTIDLTKTELVHEIFNELNT